MENNSIQQTGFDPDEGWRYYFYEGATPNESKLSTEIARD